LKTYLRILSFARPIGKFLAPFIFFSVLSSLFGVLNFTLLQPVLSVLFKVKSKGEVLATQNSFDITALFNQYIQRIVNQFGEMKALEVVCLVIVVSVLLSNIFKYVAVRMIETLKARTVANLRQGVFDKTISLDLGFFSNERKGDLMARITTDVQEIENSVGRIFTAFGKEIFTLVFFFLTLFFISSKLTLFTLVIIPISGIVIGTLSKKLKENAQEVQEKLSNVISLLDESFGGIRVVKGFNAENFIKSRFKSENFGYRDSLLKMYFRQEVAPPFSEFMGVLIVVVILLYGGSLVLNGHFEASTFITYIVIFSQVLRPAKEISTAISSIQRGVAAGERIFSLMDTKSDINDAPNAIAIKEFSSQLSLNNVSFEYETGTPVLQDISFIIPKGQTVALVGSSGGGKSTIADLIPRFYDPNLGQVLIDGHDLRLVTQSSLRNLMGIVTQESILFNDTVFNNIAFGIHATLDEVIAAAKIANAHQFISEIPEGYQSIIGDRGTKLSGGQRQRLSIARAILKNPPILILDEATSALDTESEKLVQEALAYLMKNRTTLVIAHRLSTIQNADLILVVNQGKIIEKGRHDDLLAIEDGFYKKLNSMQM
jgi:subfamily B ATP-binding cassette protein MsbA